MDLPTSISISVFILTAGGITLTFLRMNKKNPGNNGNGVSRREMTKAVNKVYDDVRKKFKEIVLKDVCDANIERIEQKIDLTTSNLSEKMDKNHEFMKEMFDDLKLEIRNGR